MLLHLTDLLVEIRSHTQHTTVCLCKLTQSHVESSLILLSISTKAAAALIDVPESQSSKRAAANRKYVRLHSARRRTNSVLKGAIKIYTTSVLLVKHASYIHWQKQQRPTLKMYYCMRVAAAMLKFLL